MATASPRRGVASPFRSHQNAFVPSGGWNEWLRQHQPIGFGAGSMEAHAREPAPKPWRAKEMQQFIATADDCEDPMVQVLDCRSEAEYTGEDKRGNKRGGHIPGARHLDWRLMCDSRHPEYLKSPEERADLIAVRQSARGRRCRQCFVFMVGLVCACVCGTGHWWVRQGSPGGDCVPIWSSRGACCAMCRWLGSS